MNQLLQKIPTPVLVLSVLLIAMGLMVFNNPLQDGCGVEIDNFKRKMAGVLAATRNTKKRLVISEAQRNIDFCRTGNSIGACADYFTTLKKISDSLMVFKSQCLDNLSKDEQIGKILLSTIKSGLSTMALVAWGEAPPDGPSSRVGWLSSTQVQTFCRLKIKYESILGYEQIESLRNAVYRQYPDRIPTKFFETDSEEALNSAHKPFALKLPSNPQGTMSLQEVHERSLFSLNCENYL